MWQIYKLVESQSEFLTYQVLTHDKNRLWEKREVGQLLVSFWMLSLCNSQGILSEAELSSIDLELSSQSKLWSNSDFKFLLLWPTAAISGGLGTAE